MSGVGAPATRPRLVARARRGVGNAQRPICPGLGPRLCGQFCGICLGLGPQLHGPAPAWRRRPPLARLYVWGWGPSYTAPPCSAGA
eukprot:gene8064-biopygen16603